MKFTFTEKLLDWYHSEGRHDLPWKNQPTPYRVWVSEIMLQQTQVSTVINYYQKFIDKFSSIKLLAEAPQNAVLNLWSGLGYYARARNLHRCAQIVYQKYQGVFPQSVDSLAELPGIGRSTAGAILSFSMNIRASILDGNVKRVLTRYYAIEGDIRKQAAIKKLWELAEKLTPDDNFSQYNQAIMDLGATICTRHKPACLCCPLMGSCLAFIHSRTLEFPAVKKNQKPRPKKTTQMLIIKNTLNAVFLEKRPSSGIWGGLWSFPECANNMDLRIWCLRTLNAEVLTIDHWTEFTHAFSHFELTIQPVVITVHSVWAVMENSDKIWYHFSQPLPGGISAPVSKLLTQLKSLL